METWVTHTLHYEINTNETSTYNWYGFLSLSNFLWCAIRHRRWSFFYHRICDNTNNNASHSSYLLISLNLTKHFILYSSTHSHTQYINGIVALWERYTRTTSHYYVDIYWHIHICSEQRWQWWWNSRDYHYE